MFTPLRSLSLSLLLCSPALALLRDLPNIISPIISSRTANTSAITTQCGRNAAPGNETCPLNVCCSEYGNCGTTTDFCGTGCQNNCDLPQLSTCTTNDSSSLRTVGYYESWANTRKCQTVSPKDLNVTGFTHLNYAFLMFDPDTFAIAQTAESDGPLAMEFTDLKTANAGLQTWIAIGGWNFNEPSTTATAFSDMEYPSASDRGGEPADRDNLVLLTQEIRAAFGTRYGLSITLPASYFYMQNFDPAGMQEHVDFFNIMTYDMHGVWDKDTVGAGAYILPHTNLTEIDGALDLLWRSKVVPEKVNLGLAWYGRSFTLSEPNCTTPNGVCEFSGAGMAGPCSDSKGTLDLWEIQDIVSEGRVTPTLDQKAGVKFVAYNETQWVSYDDEETIRLKRKFANERCLGGTMVWAMDQADQKGACGLPKAVRPSSAFNFSTSGSNSTSPANCTLLPISDSNTTCTSILASTGSNFTSAQLKAWNPQVASWEPLSTGQSICVSPPGGWYVLAQPPLMAPKGTASGTNASSTASANGPSNTQAGISPACNSYATAAKGDTCINFAKAHGIEPAQLYEWNFILGPDGANCATLFWTKETYCVGVGTISVSDSPGVPQSPRSSYSCGESSVSSATYTASAPSSTLAVVTPFPPSSTGNSLPVSSESICFPTVTSSITQTLTETVYETSSVGSVS